MTVVSFMLPYCRDHENNIAKGWKQTCCDYQKKYKFNFWYHRKLSMFAWCTGLRACSMWVHIRGVTNEHGLQNTHDRVRVFFFIGDVGIVMGMLCFRVQWFTYDKGIHT